MELPDVCDGPPCPERVDDLLILIHLLLQMEVATIVDDALPQPHGNRKGLSYGQLSVLLLCYIMSQADHRLCAVEAWVNAQRHSLEQATGWSIGEHDLRDDRLGALVELIGTQADSRAAIEVALGQRMIAAYELPTEVARCDTSSCWQWCRRPGLLPRLAATGGSDRPQRLWQWV